MKDIEILQVINEEASHPVEYASVMTGTYTEEIDKALSALDLSGNAIGEEYDDLVNAVGDGNPWWIDGHCFVVVNLALPQSQEV